MIPSAERVLNSYNFLKYKTDRGDGMVRHAIISTLFAFLLATVASATDWAFQRNEMVRKDLAQRDIVDALVLEAMKTVERHKYVPDNVRQYAYADRPLPIGEGQTISQPYIVGLMSQLLEIKPGMKVLEIGTGSGYQAAVLYEMGADVYSIEIISTLAGRTKRLFGKLNLSVRIKNADGYFGWEEFAPFDRIIITAAANHIPRPLLNQLKSGGKLILPLGNIRFYQTLTLITVDKKRQTHVEHHGGVRFVPMTGKMLN